jgi:hypothetical protein
MVADIVMPPQGQGVLESFRRTKAIIKAGGDGNELGLLCPEQLTWVSLGPVQQRELDQELGSDVPGVCHWRAQPRLCSPLPGRGGLGQQADWSPAGVLLSGGPDQAEQLQRCMAR